MMSRESEIQRGLLILALGKNRSVSEVIGQLSSETGRPEDEVTKELVRLIEEKRLLLTEKRPYRSMLEYIFSPYSFWFLGALGATFLSVVLVEATSGVLILLRYFFGSALILFLPGFSLVELLFGTSPELDKLESMALSIGLSLGLTALAGLVLSYTPLGLSFVPNLSSLAALTVALLFLAEARKHGRYKLVKGLV
jgi:uncharacterized membrane protein